MKNKYLITGFSGFVGQYFLDFFEKEQNNSKILGLDTLSPLFNIKEYENISCSFTEVDLLNDNKLESIICGFQPDYILHLASFSSVAYSWKDPILSFRNNTNIFLNLLEIIRRLGLNTRILSIGSSEEYGNISNNDLPLTESHILNPLSPYAVARISQEMLSKVYAHGYGLDIVMTRSFNHIGPKQKDIFAIPSFVKQLVQFKKNHLNHAELITGDTSIIRDFLDVRDVVRAYYDLFNKGRKGEVYNVCSGKGLSLREIINMLTDILDIDIQIKEDETLKRPTDNRIIIGSNAKIKKETGWEPKIKLKESLIDIINYWQSQII